MEEGKDSRVSTYILTCRVKPGEVLKDINFKFNFEGGYIIDFVHDLAVVTFDAVEGDWDQKREQAYKHLETIISGITLQVEYPFEIEPIHFVQDKPRDEVDSKSFLYGKLGPLEPIIQASPPIVTNKHFQQASFFVAVSELEPYLRMAMVDYRAAQRFPPESIVFCARALEWSEGYFEQTTGSGAGGANQSARDIMRRELCLPKKHFNQFFKIANETVIARHSGNLDKIREPTLIELQYCIYQCRIILDRFAYYVTYANHCILRKKLWSDFEPDIPKVVFEGNNPSFRQSLEDALSGKLQ